MFQNSQHKNKQKMKGILFMFPIAFVVTIVLSIFLGAKSIEMNDVFEAFVNFDEANVDHQIITYSRFPRAIGAFLIGCFLSVSGAMMQGVTRNYLASPSIMGVTAGSGFAITLCIVFMPQMTIFTMVLISMIGSLLGVLIVFGLATLVPQGFSPIRLAIIGTIIGAFLTSISSAIAIYFKVTQYVSFWYNTRLHQLNPDFVWWSVPFGVVGITIALIYARSITILSLGEETAIGLGSKTKWIKTMVVLSVALLTGVSVALAGGIAFVGLIMPHIARFIVGIDYRYIIPTSGILGGLFLVFADIGSRFMNYPFETPINVITTIIGVPFFLFLIKKKGGRQHA